DRIVQLFENNTNSVVNIFDVTLRPQLNVTGVVEESNNVVTFCIHTGRFPKEMALE
ncbi:protease Do-like 8 chloroplastic-like, partial [Trifolium medium]|nr:protease Do-like 8 chloroplastic-like [Trifolium medium]